MKQFRYEKKKKDMIIRQIQSLIPPPLFSTAFSLSPLWAVEENDSPRVNNKEVYGMWRMWSYSTWNSNEGVTAAWLMLHPNINSHLVLLPSLCRRTHSWRETVGKKKERKKKIAANSTSACQSGTHIGTSDRGERGGALTGTQAASCQREMMSSAVGKLCQRLIYLH